MVINESKKEFGIKLLDYYNSIMMELKDSGDKESKQWVINRLIPKYKEIIEGIVLNQP
jgi:hypothetical protein|nr:MAG TPA: hypothetical protein [Caudoviricetes sp.]